MLTTGGFVKPEYRLVAATGGGGTGSTSVAARYRVSFRGVRVLRKSIEAVPDTDHTGCWWAARSAMANLCESHLKHMKSKNVQTTDLKVLVHFNNIKKLLKSYKTCLFICFLR